MKAWIAACAASGLLCMLALSTGSVAQETSANTVATRLGDSSSRDVEVAAGAFSRQAPVPSWVEPIAMPDAGAPQPVVARIADTQFLIGESPVAYIRRALTVNDAGSLTAIGQISIPFNPQYQRLELHAVHIVRGSEILDRTA